MSNAEGNYIQSKKNGFGKYTYPNKDVYEGHWVEDRRVGRGSGFIAEMPSRSLTGQWEQDVDGTAFILCDDGSKYCGRSNLDLKYWRLMTTAAINDGDNNNNNNSDTDNNNNRDALNDEVKDSVELVSL